MLAIFQKTVAHPPQELNSPIGQPQLADKAVRLCKATNEALFVIEAYRTLRDRSPYPADQVVKDLDGSFAFIIYDDRAGTIFAALGAAVLGIAADGSVAISDEQMLIKGSCGNEGGLKSFEHPMNRMKAMPRVDSEGVMCGATFNVDAGSRISAMPRVGSAASWSPWGEAP
ncbi:unnamed protein product [Spirodela intermedia]|uniref:DUF3700 domain-containing protein n=1 Tax=Spirodela intermedia TaxID=51605 RepID=A0A7I8IXV4_SPIIN|nr:unnamed protein product [Spirodela intermedia]CAA6662678.1 unnamed protein product [Spirodela intermedia]